MDSLEKALELRKVYRVRSTDPMRTYRNRLREPSRLLRWVESQALPERVKREARRHFLVCVCAAFESYWREFVRINIDWRKVPHTVIERVKGRPFSLADLQLIIGRKVSLGELASCAFPFQGADDVNASLSELLRIDLFSEFSRAEFPFRRVEPTKRLRSKENAPYVHVFLGREILRNSRTRIERCFEVRHATVHSRGITHRVDESDAVWAEGAAWEFSFFLGLHLERCLDELWGPLRQPARGAAPSRHAIWTQTMVKEE